MLSRDRGHGQQPESLPNRFRNASKSSINLIVQPSPKTWILKTACLEGKICRFRVGVQGCHRNTSQLSFQALAMGNQTESNKTKMSPIFPQRIEGHPIRIALSGRNKKPNKKRTSDVRFSQAILSRTTSSPQDGVPKGPCLLLKGDGGERRVEKFLAARFMSFSTSRGTHFMLRFLK